MTIRFFLVVLASFDGVVLREGVPGRKEEVGRWYWERGPTHSLIFSGINATNSPSHFREPEEGQAKHEESALEVGSASDHKECFAERTEAYLHRNDFSPFVRAELKEHDPTLHAVLEKIWGPAL